MIQTLPSYNVIISLAHYIITLHTTAHIITLLYDYYYIPFNNISKSVNVEFCSDVQLHTSAQLYHTTLKNNPHFHLKNEQNKTKPDDSDRGERNRDAGLTVHAVLRTWSLGLRQPLFGSGPTCRLEGEPQPTSSPNGQNPHQGDPDAHKHSPGGTAQADGEGWRKEGEKQPPWAALCFPTCHGPSFTGEERRKVQLHPLPHILPRRTMTIRFPV